MGVTPIQNCCSPQWPSQCLLISWVCAHNMNALCVTLAIRYVAHHQATEAVRRGCTHVTHRNRRQHRGRDHRGGRDDRPVQVQPRRLAGGGIGLPRPGGRPWRGEDDRLDHDGIRRHHGRGRPADRVRRVDGRDTAADGSYSASGANAAETVRAKAHALCHVADDCDAASVDLSRCAACHLGTAGPQPRQEDRQERNRAHGDGHGHRPRMRNRSDRSRCGRACAGRPARCATRQDVVVRCAACHSDRRDRRGDHVVPVQSRLVEPGARRAGVPRRGSRTPR